MTDWQPIETAPKDGSRLLLTDGKFLTVGHWRSYQWASTERWWTDNPVAFLEEDEQSPNYDHSFDEYVTEPTHWAPLNAPHDRPHPR